MRSLHTPHFHMPQWRRGRARAVAATEADQHPHHHHHPAFQTARRLEGGIDLIAILLVVVLAAAMLYAILTAAGYPAYFDRWPS